jgi:CAAX protease family protein
VSLSSKTLQKLVDKFFPINKSVSTKVLALVTRRRRGRCLSEVSRIWDIVTLESARAAIRELENVGMQVVSSGNQPNCLKVAEMNFSRQRVSMIVFFLVAFLIPWAASIAARMRHVAFPEGTPTFMFCAAFCSVGGVVATYIAAGRAGVKELTHRCVLYRVSVVWWLYALFLAVAVHAVATIIYGAVHGRIGPITPLELFHRWWLFYIFVFGLFQGPLAEELGWRGFLLPRLLDKFSPLESSAILGLVWAVWHINVFFSPISTWALFAASTVALSILMTVMFLHTRGSVLLAIVMHWSIVSGKYVVGSLFPASQEPPDWL